MTEDNEESHLDQTGEDEASENFDTDYKLMVILATFSFLAVFSFFFIQFGVTDIISLNFSKILSFRLLSLFVLPVPFAFVATISKNKFRWESLSSITALLLLPANLKLAVISLTVFLGSIVTSYAVSKIYQEDESFTSFYKSTSYAFLLMALIVASLFVYTYNTNSKWRKNVQIAAANQSKKLAMSMPFGPSDMRELTTDQAEDYKKRILNDVRGALYNKINNLNLSQRKKDSLKRELNITHNQPGVQMQESLNLSKQETIGEVDLSPFFQKVFEPSLKVNAILFVFVFSLAAIFKYLFAILSSLYAELYLWAIFSKNF